MKPITAISQILTEQFDTTLEQVSVRRRNIDRVILRQAIHTCLARYSELSYMEISDMTGRQDHSTVSHSKRCVERMEEHCKKHGAVDKLLDCYMTVETNYLRIMLQNSEKVQRKYRSYKEELKATRV